MIWPTTNINLFVLVIFLYVLLLFAAALSSGLTVGLLGLYINKEKEQVLLQRDSRKAQMLIWLKTRHHLLLVTLLLVNSFCVEMMPLLLSNLGNTSVTVISSSLILLIFGEIIPQALFTSKYQLAIITKLIPVIYFMVRGFQPLTYLFSVILDKAFCPVVSLEQPQTNINVVENKNVINSNCYPNRISIIGFTTSPISSSTKIQVVGDLSRMLDASLLVSINDLNYRLKCFKNKLDKLVYIVFNEENYILGYVTKNAIQLAIKFVLPVDEIVYKNDLGICNFNTPLSLAQDKMKAHNHHISIVLNNKDERNEVYFEFHASSLINIDDCFGIFVEVF